MSSWSESTDLSGMREQILANVSITFPLLHPSIGTPGPGPNDQPYSLITRRNGASESEAIVLYGPHNRVFAYGIGMAGDQSSMVALLETTKAVVQRLFLEEKLKPLPNESAVTTLAEMGAYEGEKEV